ncbi:unnamed protein product [Discosporangium mesarthrocarpum]
MSNPVALAVGALYVYTATYRSRYRDKSTDTRAWLLIFSVHREASLPSPSGPADNYVVWSRNNFLLQVGTENLRSCHPQDNSSDTWRPAMSCNPSPPPPV